MRAFVSEDWGEGPFAWSGRFAVSLADGTLGPQSAPLAEALEWARERADVVLVMAGDDAEWYSAGRSNPEGLPEWPEGRTLEPRTDRRHTYVDRTEHDPPIVWRVDVSDGGDFEVRARTWEEANRLAGDLIAAEPVGPRGSSYVGYQVRPAD